MQVAVDAAALARSEPDQAEAEGGQAQLPPQPLEAVLAAWLERGVGDTGFHGGIIVGRVLFRLAQLQGIAAGEIDLQFRRWDRPRARAGAKQVTAVGVIRIDDVRVVRRVTKAEARRAGFATPEDVVRALRPDGDLYRIALHLEGPDPRVELRERIATGDDLAVLRRAVERLPWAMEYLRAIRDNPAVRAEELAASFGLEKRVFKPRVRRLKELGLTISLSPGYRLSPRGEAFVKREGPG